MQTYDLNRNAIKTRIREKYPDSKSLMNENNHPDYILWMIDQIPVFLNQGKIDRWIGCVQGLVYSLGLFGWNELRELTRQDLKTSTTNK